MSQLYVWHDPIYIYNHKKCHLYFYFYLVLFVFLLNDGKITSIIRLSTSCSLFCFPIFFCGIIGALTIQCLTIFHLDRLSLSGMIVSLTLVSVFNVRLIAFDHRFLSAFFLFMDWIFLLFETQFLLRQTWWSQLMNSKLFCYNFFAPKEPAKV